MQMPKNLFFEQFPIPKACLGTMNFGEHTDEKTSWEIMDTALEHGVNFFDTAELYSIPAKEETYGKTEEIIGRWMKERGNREKIILASKVVGPARGAHGEYIRNGKTRLNEENILRAVEGSLQRLKTDYIDLYQLHWPDRNVNKFGQRAFIPFGIETKTEIEETLLVLQKLQKSGKIKHIGVSNETPWGTMEFIRLAREKNLPKIVSIQNNYSLLTRTYDTAMAEISFRENIPLLGYSPLGFGALVHTRRQNGRFEKFPDNFCRYQSDYVKSISHEYRQIAKKHDMSVSQMAIAFAASRKFMGSVILGPANVEQTIDGINAINIKLPKEIFAEIDAVHEKCPNICP